MKQTLILASLISVCMAQAQPSMTEWHDMEVNEVNRLPLHADYFAYENETAALHGDKTSSERFLSLDGQWKFRWDEHADQRPHDFFLTGYDDSGWKEMGVPGIWELNGYGDPVYLNIGFHHTRHMGGTAGHSPLGCCHLLCLSMGQRPVCRLCRRLQSGCRI